MERTGTSRSCPRRLRSNSRWEGSRFGSCWTRPGALPERTANESRVDDIIAEAEKAGATILKPPATLPWGGYGGSFATRTATSGTSATALRERTSPTRSSEQAVPCCRGFAVATSFWPQARQVRHSVESRKGGVLRASCPSPRTPASPNGTGSHRLMIGSSEAAAKPQAAPGTRCSSR
jgi:hypothetical protein